MHVKHMPAPHRIDAALPKVLVQEFRISSDGLGKLVRWVTRQTDTLIALEGRNGQSKRFERTLRSAGVVFYSFTEYEVSKFRSAVLGQNKNSEKDAEAVARYALALETQNRLERSRREWFVDEDQQTMTRLLFAIQVLPALAGSATQRRGRIC